MAKPAIFHRTAREVIRTFPLEVRRAIGKAVWELQQGTALTMPLSKAMPIVGTGVAELRLKDRTGAYRVFYVAQRQDGVFVFHAFTKKAQKTPRHEIELGRRRLKELTDEQA